MLGVKLRDMTDNDDIDLRKLAQLICSFELYHYKKYNKFDTEIINPLINSHMIIDEEGNITNVSGMKGYLKNLPDGLFVIYEDQITMIYLANVLEDIFTGHIIKMNKLYKPTIERIQFELA